MDLAAFQQLMADTYGERDRGRGVPATVAWLTEELGELAQAVRKGDREAQVHELGDVLAWLASLAGQLGIDLDEAAARYADGCPRCGATRPCRTGSRCSCRATTCARERRSTPCRSPSWSSPGAPSDPGPHGQRHGAAPQRGHPSA